MAAMTSHQPAYKESFSCTALCLLISAVLYSILQLKDAMQTSLA